MPRAFILPAREVKPTVGLIPARLLLLEGAIILPSVSEPNVIVANPIDAATPGPEKEPLGSGLAR